MRIASKTIDEDVALSPFPPTTVQRFADAVVVRHEVTGVRG
jgi:hypothetical protein